MFGQAGRKVFKVPSSGKESVRRQSPRAGFYFFKQIDALDVDLYLNLAGRCADDHSSSPHVTPVLEIHDQTLLPVADPPSLGPLQGISGPAEVADELVTRRQNEAE